MASDKSTALFLRGTRSRFGTAILGAALLGSAGMIGCSRSRPQGASVELPVVPVSIPVIRDITDHVDFTGRTDAVNAVDIRPRVTGYLVQMPFKEGAEVKTGDLLFEVDPRPYQAQLNQAESQVRVFEAELKLAQVTRARDRSAESRVPGAVSQLQLDQDLATVQESDARFKAYRASTEVFRLNLAFTRIMSPIDGQVSRYYLTLGNLVNQDQTVLTTVVSLDPMYVYFDMDEPTLIRIKKAINEGRIRLPGDGPLVPVFIGLQGEDGYPYQGTINFINNQVNPGTGSISIRGVFPNARPPNGTRLLAPGMFVRVRLPIGDPHPALLVIDRAVGSDQGLKYVFVVDSGNLIQYRRVTVGTLQEDGLRAIAQGLKAGDRVVVGGLPRLHANMHVRPELHPMPTLEAEVAQQAPSANSPTAKPSPSAKTGRQGRQP